jgi:hypothetical protein
MWNRQGAAKVLDTPTTSATAATELTASTPDILALTHKAVLTAREKPIVQLHNTVIKRTELLESQLHDMAQNIQDELLKRDQRIDALENKCQQQQNVKA